MLPLLTAVVGEKTTTHVRVYQKDLQRIRSAGNAGDTYPEVIERLLDSASNQSKREQTTETDA